MISVCVTLVKVFPAPSYLVKYPCRADFGGTHFAPEMYGLDLYSNRATNSNNDREGSTQQVHRYEVIIRNELTGEELTVTRLSYCAQDAQIEALVQAFKNQGWRKAVAFPVELGPAQPSAE